MPVPNPPGDAAELRREQEDVGISCARTAGGIFTAASALHFVALSPPELLPVLPSLLLLVVGAAVQLSSRRAGPSGARAVITGLLLNVAALAAFLGPGVDDRLRALLGAITMLTSMAVPSGLFAIGARPRMRLVAVIAILPTMALGAAATWESGRAAFVLLSIVVCWTLAFSGSRWLASSVERAFVGTAALRTAHDAERRSSESEARRRSDARLMHDTILSTLTLVAHRGEGVAPETLRAQAAADLGLLRGLEAGPELGRGGALRLPGPLLEAGRRAEARGLDIRWHVASEVRLAASTLDALARAVGECLENVRRHSGASAAHLTVVEEAGEIRIAVSDDGCGFDPAAVPAGRLGLAQSVVGRLEAVGGAVRVFSAPGSGTTVLLSVS
ncbi:MULTISPECIES: sensor histidine kinase [unclassified Rathayibacter]|uniref:sensor histidine kinase n=1 Tax=unclassified Rathayibacter TaxID=2609250 RepID=UPI00188BA543|nr:MULTISPECIES: ATP-binding protein [unclassified Rathayibacter]MBF4461364.1 hypothetical protein [Rathayibacter sp. VKM Ac-2879]MBF4502775.1 hypothetical protein [Rathayibacter sp. VKM Ac-2878]